MKLLVSYVRWSTKAQDSGDSLRRQNDMIDAFYHKHSDQYFMSPTHRYVDKGKSGFHQKHKAEGESSSGCLITSYLKTSLLAVSL